MWIKFFEIESGADFVQSWWRVSSNKKKRWKRHSFSSDV